MLNELTAMYRTVWGVLFAAASFGIGLSVGQAQTTLIGNQFIQGILFTSPPENRFTINAGSAQNGVKFLYGATSNTATSNIVFRIESGGSVYYYGNCNTGSAFGYKPIEAETGRPVTYKAFDSLYVSKDTVAIGYKNMSGWNITQRWIVEKPRTPYDDGSDLLLEFSATVNPFTPSGTIGVFLMFDLFNGEAGDPNPSDYTAVITDRAYYPRGLNGKRFDPRFDTIPNFYTTGNVTMQPAALGSGVPYNIRMPIHRLTGMSQGGKPLTSPNMFAIGDWRVRMREYSWEAPSSEVGTTPLNDAATCMRWEGITDGKTIRTAFGMNNRLGNNIYTCRDTGFFVMMRTERVVEQRVKNGTYSPTAFDLEVWVVNLDNSLQRDILLYFQTPIQSNRGPNRLLLDASTPATQGLTIPANGVRKTRFRLNFNPAYSDDSADVVPEIRYALPTRPGVIRRFKQLCTPTITIKKFIDIPPPVDTIPPVIQRGTPGRATTAFWPFKIFDRHSGYRWDSGLDGIVVEANDGANFTIQQVPAPFRRCDTNETVDITVSVVDTTRPGRIVFRTFDCRGNISRDSAIYSPRPDIFAPVILRIDSTGSYGPLCNARQYDLYVIDSLNQTPTAGDNGLGVIEVLGTPVNFDPIEVNFDRGGVSIADFEKRASARVRVIDTLLDGHVDLRIADYAGNADTVSFDYCTLPDVEMPRSTVTPTSTGGPWSWHVEASDSLPWDRGLMDLVVLSNPGNNMTFGTPPITPGAKSTGWDVSVVDDRVDASIVFEVRDMWYNTTPQGHADTIAVTFVSTPDTLAPNIIFAPIGGSGGSRADVEVNDIHYFGVDRYRYDLGLATIRVTDISPNMELSSPILFVPGDSVASFGIRIKDTLALNTIDSVCLEAVDLAGNRSTLCYRYPIVPDLLPPVFTGQIDGSRSQLTGTLTDARLYDRGLGEVRIESPQNLDITTADAFFSGEGSSPYAVAISDPAMPVSGTLVVRDLVALRDATGESDAIHSVRIPFELPVASIMLHLPEYVEGGSEFSAVVVANSDIPGRLVSSLAFTINTTGTPQFARSADGGAVCTAAQIGPGRLSVQLALDGSTDYGPGDTLAVLIWTAERSRGIETFMVDVDDASLVANNGASSVATGGPIGTDTAISRIVLPPPLFRMAADSTVFVNGDCERFLSTTRAASRPSGLAILGIRPHPLTSGRDELEIDVRDLASDGGSVDLIAASGVRTPLGSLPRTDARVSRVSVRVPRELASGVYALRIVSGGSADWVRVVVVR